MTKENIALCFLVAFTWGVLMAGAALAIEFMTADEVRTIEVHDGHEYAVVKRAGVTVSQCHSASCQYCYEIFD